MPQFKQTLMSKFTPDKPDSPALTRQSPRVSTKNMLAGVAALLHIERMSQIPMST